MIRLWTRSQAEKKGFRWVGALDYRLDTPFEIILVAPTSGNGLTIFWFHFDTTLCLSD